jgi:hypothetical protein
MESNLLVVHRPQIAFESQEESNFARVTIEPLEPGFGYTLGNSLRRTLISSTSSSTSSSSSCAPSRRRRR